MMQVTVMPVNKLLFYTQYEVSDVKDDVQWQWCVDEMCYRGSKAGRLLFQLRSQPVGLKRVNKAIVVACMDNTLQCFSIKVWLHHLFSFCFILLASFLQFCQGTVLDD